MSFEDKDLQSMQEARILIETAKMTQETIKEYDQFYLDKLVTNLIDLFDINALETTRSAVNSIGFGNAEDEYELYQQFIESFKQEYTSKKYVGILATDEKQSPVEVGIPLGVIGIQLPATNMVLSVLYATLICLKSGNTVVFIPDSKAVEQTNEVVALIDQLIIKNQGPSGMISCLRNVSSKGVEEISNHDSLALFIAIGLSDFVDLIIKGKAPFIFGGMGSSPVFIEKTANIHQACQMIVRSRSFNNGLLPGAEQYVVVEQPVALEVKKALLNEGAYFMNSEEEEKLLKYILNDNHQIVSNCIGKSAYDLASKAGFSVNESTRVLVSEQPYINDENPYAEELPIPLLTFYPEPDWIKACEKCIDLLEYKKNGHTLVIHSENKKVITEFILKKPVGRIIVNGLGGLNSLGIHSKLPTSMILGGLTTHRGFSAENVTPKHLTYVRQVGYSNEQIKLNQHVANNQSVDGLEELNVFAELLRELTN